MITLLFSCLQVYQWYSLSHITGGGTGTIAKIMVSATDDVLESISTKILLLEILQQLFTEQLLLFLARNLEDDVEDGLVTHLDCF